MTSIKQCPVKLEARTSRSNINKCPTLDNYHCLKTEDGQLRELCTSPIWIEPGKCPIYSATGKLDARICQATPSRECPTKIYKSNANFNYAGCLPRLRVESHTTKVTGDEQTTQIHINVMPSNSSGTSASLIAVFIVVPLLFVGLVFLWWKRNKIRKLINNPFRSRNTTNAESDIEATGTFVISDCAEKTKDIVQSSNTDEESKLLLNVDESAKDRGTNYPATGEKNMEGHSSMQEKPNKKSRTEETKRSLNIKEKDAFRRSSGKKEIAEKTKDIVQNSNTDEESKLLLNVDESAKENNEKIKDDTPDNDHKSKEIKHLWDKKLTKEQLSSKPSTKESKRSSFKFKFPFRKRSRGQHKDAEEIEDTASDSNKAGGEGKCLSDDISIIEQQNNKPTKEEIKRPENKKTSKADACRKTKNDEKIKDDTSDNDHIRREVSHLLDEKFTKEKPNRKPSTKESKRSSFKFKFPFQKRSSGRHKNTEEIEDTASDSNKAVEGKCLSDDISIIEQENNKPPKEEIKRPENEKKFKAGAFGKTKKQNNMPTKEEIKRLENEKRSKADAFGKTEMAEETENVYLASNSTNLEDQSRMETNSMTIDQSQSMVLFKEDMANLLLKKDVLILVCSQQNEKIDLGVEIAMIACAKTTGAHLRVFNTLDDFDQFESLTKDNIALLVSFDCSRNFDLFSKTQISNTFKRIKKAARSSSKTKTCHTLICIHKSTCIACKKSLKKSSMTYEAYDISTMQIY